MAKKISKYSEAAQELTEILEGLEAQAVDVDELADKVKRAGELIDFCRAKLDSTETQVKKIVKEFEEKKI